MKVEMQDIAAIASAQHPPHLNSPTQARHSEKPPPVESDKVSLVTTISRQNVETTQRMNELGDSLNAAAGAIRQADRNLDSAADTVDKMKGTLEKIIKNFPPFPPDSKERQEILMSYISIQKEILSLTFPSPPPKEYEKMRQELPISSEGKLVTYDLTQQATDPDVAEAWQLLDKISGQILSVREQLRNDLKGSV